MMRRRYRYTSLGLGYVVTIGIVLALLSRHGIAVFEPMGTLAAAERHLIVVTLMLSLIVVIPVFVMLFGFAWRYRESNTAATYAPDFDHNRTAETIWWVVPLALIVVLAVITWRSSHELDPYRALAASDDTMTIQVVSLDWKWLFIYPDDRVATVNYVEIPTGQAVRFELTSDAPMNSFWVPQLSGQVYTMPAMTTQLNVRATSNGDFKGSSANISGKGFAGMTFTVRARSPQDYATWLATAQTSRKQLTYYDYENLAKPSENVAPFTYGSVDEDLFAMIVAKYSATPPFSNGTNNTDGSDMKMDTTAMPGMKM